MAGTDLGTAGDTSSISHRSALAAVLLESVTAAVFAFDRDWRYSFINAAAEQFLGRPREQLLGRQCWQVFPEFRAHENAAKAELAMRSRQLLVWDSESTISGRWAQWRAYPVADGGLSLFVEDIQDQRDMLVAERRARDEAEQARQAAENAREELRGIVAAIPSAVAVTRGYDPVFELVNPAYEALIGHRSVVGRAMAEVFPYVTRNGFIDILRQIQQTGEEMVLPERRVVYDRENNGVMYEGYFTSFLAPLRDRDGVINGVVTSGMEVTDLVRQRERIQALVDEAEAGRALLEQARAELESRIEERTAELARSNAALAAEIEVRTRDEALRADLLRRLATAREDEQRRTARDLHDQVGQSVSALMLAIKAACDAETLPEGAAARLADALRLAEDLGRDVHDLATRLRPAALDEFGLHAALRQLTSTWSRRFGLAVDLQASWLQRERLPADVETVLYRVVQEALTNVARHAHARRVSVVVERHAGHAIAVIEDDGVGFDVSAPTPNRLGLVGMTERVTLVGGTLEIESGPAGGVTVIARVPVAQAAAP